MVEDYAKSQESTVGRIGSHVFIRNTRYLNGVRIGDYAVISGVNRLRNGTVHSKEAAPAQIGHGVIADNFIICSGSHLTDNATFTNCFIGQACHFGHGYSASDSLFFSNCQGENGEACAIFAGPFTVTHHKSTLLIAGHFSFMNAGSGSNQSNHMYKLGPIHQGILERGAKTSSDSYILWPSRVGAFSLVMGRHVNHSDTTWLPFSYLIEQQNTTYLVPGVNLRSVGTIRDAQKIRNSSLRKGLDLYRIAITKFLGNSIIKKLEDLPADASDEALREALKPELPDGKGKWTDLSGLIAPKELVDALLDRIEKGEVKDLETVDGVFRRMHADYYRLEWTWAYDKYAEFFGFPLETVTAAQVREIVMKWKEAVIGLDEMLYEDARKEFNLASMTGFGADGSREEKELDLGIWEKGRTFTTN